MLRRVLGLSAALALACGGGQAAAATETVPVKGDVHAVAFSGSALIVARHPAKGGLVVERRAPGAARQIIYTESDGDPSDQLVLAASPDAVALAIQAGGDDLSPNRVLVGPPGGPLRLVSGCDAGLIVSPVAAAGARVAWRDGGCGSPIGNPRSVTAAAIVVGGADGVPVRRTELGTGRLPAALHFNGDSGIIGLLSPAFLMYDSQISRFGPAGLGSLVASEQGRLTTPVGLLPDGTSVASVATDGSEQDQPCSTELFAVAPGGSARRPLSLGGCYVEGEYPFVTNTAATSADRVFALVAEPPAAPNAPARVTLADARADGSGREAIASGTYHAPIGFAVGTGRVAWWQSRCVGGDEIVMQDGVPGSAPVAVPSCRVALLTRRARVRKGRITLRVRCRSGCTGQAFSESFVRSLTRFTIRPGTRAVHMAVSRADRRRGRIRVQVEVANGPDQTRIIRLLG